MGNTQRWLVKSWSIEIKWIRTYVRTYMHTVSHFVPDFLAFKVVRDALRNVKHVYLGKDSSCNYVSLPLFQEDRQQLRTPTHIPLSDVQLRTYVCVRRRKAQDIPMLLRRRRVKDSFSIFVSFQECALLKRDGAIKHELCYAASKNEKELFVQNVSL